MAPIQLQLKTGSAGAAEEQGSLAHCGCGIVCNARDGRVNREGVRQLSMGACDGKRGVAFVATGGTVAQLRLLGFTLQELANTAWPFAARSQSDVALLSELAWKTYRRLGMVIALALA